MVDPPFEFRNSGRQTLCLHPKIFIFEEMSKHSMIREGKYKVALGADFYSGINNTYIARANDILSCSNAFREKRRRRTYENGVDHE